MTEDIYNQVVTILTESTTDFDINKNDAVPDANLIDDLGMDSLDFIEFIMELETEFEISIPDDLAENIETIQDVVDLVTKLK